MRRRFSAEAAFTLNAGLLIGSGVGALAAVSGLWPIPLGLTLFALWQMVAIVRREPPPQ